MRGAHRADNNDQITREIQAMKHSKALLAALPLLAATAQAQALTAQGITAKWVQANLFSSVIPHSIAQAEALLALQPPGPGEPDNGFVAAVTTTADRVNFFDGSIVEAEGPFAASRIMDPFTPTDAGGDARFAVSVTGSLLVPTNADYSFIVLSDDGFDFRIDGATVFELDSDRGPGESRIDLVDLTAGVHSFELIGWEQGGQFVLELTWAPAGTEDFAVLSSVPLPGALPLMAFALAGLGLRRRG